VLASALRELRLLVAGTDRDPHSVYRIRNVVLAAPDIDLGVAQQRYAADRLHRMYVDLTIYVSSKDRALGSAEWLFATPGRLGKLKPEQMDATARERLGALRRGLIVDARVRTDYLGHGYFLGNPAASSDLILVLRYNRPPGAEHGRPLTEIGPNWYIFDDKYPMQAAPLPKELRDK
jgi:esterase/lipase superfamily enzyme